MASRAQRRTDGRMVAKIASHADGQDLDTIAELAAVRRDLDTAKGYLKMYKTRLERLAMGLQFVSNALVADKVRQAQVAMRALMSNDLAEARETVGNRTMALDMAVTAMQRHDKSKDIANELEKIKRLAPEAFGGEFAMTMHSEGRA